MPRNASPDPLQIVATGGGIPSGAVELVEVAYSYNTISPLALTTLNNGDRIIRTELEVETEFDDVSATLEVGTIGDPDKVLTSLENRPTKCGTYGNNQNFKFTSTETGILTITPGTSTQGAGTVLLEIRRA